MTPAVRGSFQNCGSAGLGQMIRRLLTDGMVVDLFDAGEGSKNRALFENEVFQLGIHKYARRPSKELRVQPVRNSFYANLRLRNPHERPRHPRSPSRPISTPRLFPLGKDDTKYRKIYVGRGPGREGAGPGHAGGRARGDPGAVGGRLHRHQPSAAAGAPQAARARSSTTRRPPTTTSSSPTTF